MGRRRTKPGPAAGRGVEDEARTTLLDGQGESFNDALTSVTSPQGKLTPLEFRAHCYSQQKQISGVNAVKDWSQRPLLLRMKSPGD